MSRTIDEKVVEMRFDNSDFERNVTQSMSTLDKLKGALDFSGASKAFDGITSAANKVDLGGLTGAFDGVHKKVTNLEKVINGFFENVGRRLSNFAIDQVKGVTLEPIMEGFGKYEQKSKAVQTIMNATGQSIEDVSKQLEKLNWYTDETSYDFAEMVTTVGKFTSSGVELERAVTAMQGIANWAAVSGAEKQQANMAMYNLAQALGMGFVGAADYRSIMNANMDTREFKQMVIDEAIKEGTLAVQTLEDGTEVLVAMNKETKELIYENEKEGKLLEVNADNFYSTLTKGKWFDRDVLLNVTDKYGQFSNLLNQFYNDVIDNGFELTTSELIAYVDAYRDGTLDMNDAIKETGLSAEYLTDVLTKLSSEEFELSEKAFKAGNEARTFKDAIDATKDAVSTAWMNTFELLFGNYEEARVLWTALSNELWDIFAGPINNINKTLSKWREIELDDGTILDGRDDFINGIKDIYHALRSVVDPITEAWEAIFPPIDEFKLYDITKKFHDFTSGLVLDETRMNQVRMVFEDLFGIFKTFSTGFTNGGGFGGFLSGFGTIIDNVSDKVYNFFLGIQRIRSVMEEYENGTLGDYGIMQEIIDANPAAAKALEIYEKLVKTAETLGQTFGKIFDTTKFFKDGALTIDSIISGIETNIANILGAISEIVHIWTGTDIGKTVDNIRAILFGLFDGIKAFLGSERWAEVKYAINGIATAFKDAFGPAWQAAVAIFDDWIAGIRTLISGADGDFNGFFDTIVRGAYAVAGFVRSWKDGIQFISDFLVRFLSLTDAIEVYQANGGGILGILAVINDKIGIIIDTFADLVQNVTGFDIHGIGDGILSVIQGIGYAILQLADTIAKVFGWKDNPFGKLLGQIDSEYTGFDGISVNLVGVFQRIGDAFSKLGDIFNAVSPGISSALSGVKVVLLDVIQFFKDISADMSFPDLLHLIMQVITVFSGIKLAKKAGEMFEAIGDALTAWQKTLKVQMLLELAGAILMIAGAAVLISKIDNDKIGLVLGTLGVAFGGLIGVLAVSRAGNADNLRALPGIILSVAAAMVVLSFAAGKLADVVAKFGAIENFGDAFGNFAATLVTISILIGALAGLNARLTAKDGLTNTNVINGIVASISKLAVGMLLLLGVIKLYQMVNLKKIANGLVKIFGTLAAAGAAMGAAEWLFNFISTFKTGGFTSMESTATSMLKFSGALAILIAVIGALTLIKWGNLLSSLGKAIVAIAGFSAGLIIFSGALAVVNKLKVLDVLDKVADAMWKFAKTVAVIVGISVIIGLISEVFGDSLTDLVDKGLEFIEYAIHSLSERSATIAHDLAVIIVDIVREALRVLAENIPEITQYLVEILGGLIQGVKDAMEHGDLNIWEVIGGAGLFAGILGLVVFLKKNKIGIKDFGAAVLAIGGAAVLILEMGVLFEAIGWLADRMGGAEGLKKMQEFASGIVHVFTDDWGVLALFGVLMAFELVMAKFGDKWFGDQKNKTSATKNMWEGFKTAGALIAEVVGLVDELGVLFAATGGVVQALDFAVSWGGNFDNSVTGWIEKAGEFYGAIAKVFSEDGGVMLLFAAIAGALVIFSKFDLNMSSGGAMEEVVMFLVEAVGIIDALGVLFAATGAIIDAIEAVGEDVFGADIDFIGWVEKAGDFFQEIGAAIGKLVGGLVGGLVNGTIKEATEGVTQDMIDLIKGIGECMVVMSEAGLLAAAATWAGGPIGLAIMAAEIESMASHFVGFAKGVDELPASTVEKAATCADALSKIIGVIPLTGGIPRIFTGKKDIDAFGAGLVGLAQGISSYASALLDLSYDDISEITEKTDGVAVFVEKLKAITPEINTGLKAIVEGSNDLGTFGTTLIAFANSLSQYCQIISSDEVDLDFMESSISVNKKLTEFASDIGNLGGTKLDMVYTFGTYLTSLASNIKKYVETIKKVSVEDAGHAIGITQKIIDTFIGTENLSFANEVETLTTDFLEKMVAAFGNGKTKTKTEAAADKFIDYFRDRFLWDGTIGKISLAVDNMISKSVYDQTLSLGLQASGSYIVEELAEGIATGFEGEGMLYDKFISFLNSLYNIILYDDLESRVQNFAEAGGELINGIKTGMFGDGTASSNGASPAAQIQTEFQGLLNSLIGLIVSEEMTGQFQRGGASLINSLLGGMKSVDITASSIDVGKNAVSGVAQGVTNNLDLVEQAAKDVVSTFDGTLRGPISKGGFDINSPSWLEELVGRFAIQGLIDGVYDKIPDVKKAVEKVVETIKNGTGDIDILAYASDLGLNPNGWLEENITNFISEFGADDAFSQLGANVKEDFEEMLNGLQTGEIFSGSGSDSWNTWMTHFQTEYENSIPDLESMADGIPEIFGTSMEEYANNGYVANSATAITDNVSNVYGELYDASGDYASGSVYNYADNMLAASEEIQPILATATEKMTAPVETRLAEMLTYAEWVAKRYPEGLTKELSVPTTDFDELYENMKGGELEAILNMFDAMSDAERSRLIMSYGLGEEGGNADLASYLQWYWNNEPTRLQNLESIKQATEGYQAYLDEQKALQEAQAIQSQKNYEGVQQIAAGMNERADAADAKYMAAIEEIKMTVKSIEEELDSVHATISELNNMDVYIDSSALVGATAEKYNEELGNMAKIGRRRVTR